MQRRDFLKTAAYSGAALAIHRILPAAETPEPLRAASSSNAAALLKRSYGRKGDVQLSIIGFPGLMFARKEQDRANRIVAEAVERGVCYFDVAPAYGKAEIIMGPALEPYRKNVFLSCKTGRRTREESEAELKRSLERLKTDYFDLYQMHCIVDVAKYFMGFLKEESCGKCFTCRKGTQRMHEILEDISAGRGTPAHLDLLEELACAVKDTTMCGLGQTASNPVLSTLRYFRDEYLAHIEEGRCPAGVCTSLISYSISDNCSGCQACVRACPEKAIGGERGERHTINTAKCIKCGACYDVCKLCAVKIETGGK